MDKTDRRPGLRLAAGLWFLAAVLAFISVGLRATRGREVNWAVAAGGLFCFVMGISALTRARKLPASSA
jgi:hypothetical protein